MSFKTADALQTIGLGIMIGIFFYEENPTIAWTILTIAIITTIGGFFFSYFKKKTEEIIKNREGINKLTKEINNLKKELNTKTAIEVINYRLGRIENEK